MTALALKVRGLDAVGARSFSAKHVVAVVRQHLCERAHALRGLEIAVCSAVGARRVQEAAAQDLGFLSFIALRALPFPSAALAATY